MKKEERYQKFTEDLEKAGYAVESYEGRYFFKGPAVRIEKKQLQDVIRATNMMLQWDDLGLGLVVYPR